MSLDFSEVLVAITCATRDSSRLLRHTLYGYKLKCLVLETLRFQICSCDNHDTKNCANAVRSIVANKNPAVLYFLVNTSLISLAAALVLQRRPNMKSQMGERHTTQLLN